jgi:hypothetical protein
MPRTPPLFCLAATLLAVTGCASHPGPMTAPEPAPTVPGTPPPGPVLAFGQRLESGQGGAWQVAGDRGCVMAVSDLDAHQAGSLTYALLFDTQDRCARPHRQLSPLWWQYLRGRWPMQHTAQMLAAAEGTTAILEQYHDYGPRSCDITRVYLLWSPSDYTIPNPTSRISVWAAADLSEHAEASCSNAQEESWIESDGYQLWQGSIGASGPLRTWVDCIRAAATRRGFDASFQASSQGASVPANNP